MSGKRIAVTGNTPTLTGQYVQALDGFKLGKLIIGICWTTKRLDSEDLQALLKWSFGPTHHYRAKKTTVIYVVCMDALDHMCIIQVEDQVVKHLTVCNSV